MNHVCYVCGAHGETLCHTFYYCRFSNEVWRLCCPVILQRLEDFWENEDRWSHFFLWLQNKDLVETCLNTSWLIWNNRNQCFQNNSCRMPMALVRSANKMHHDSRLALVSSYVLGTESPATWSPPHRNCFKLNVDAAYSSDTKMAKLGMVVCDYLGNIYLCAVITLDNIKTFLQAKIKAILFDLETAHDFYYRDLLVESDSLIAIQEVSKGQGSFCEWESIIVDIVNLALECRSCSFSHVKRAANAFADSLAKLPCDVGVIKQWRNSLPPSFCNPDLNH